MKLKNVEGFDYMMCGAPPAISKASAEDGVCVYFFGLRQELEDIHDALKPLPCTIVYIVIDDWDNLLTPWPAKGLYRSDPDFEGKAPGFLAKLTEKMIPAIEEAESLHPAQRAIAGYSLAGLFSVYAFANCDVFESVASMSGSFWYEGWPAYIQSLHRSKQGCFAYISLGDKERRAKEKILHRVQDNTDITAATLRSWGMTVEQHLVPGGHFDNVIPRIQAGLAALCKNTPAT